MFPNPPSDHADIPFGAAYVCITEGKYLCGSLEFGDTYLLEQLSAKCQ